MTRSRLLTRSSLACLAGIATALASVGGASTADEPQRATAAAARTPLDSAEIARLVEFGDSLSARNDFVGAESAFRQVLDSAAASPATIKQALLGLALMHRRQGALTKAAAIYERFVRDYPNDERVPEALLELGRTLRSLGVYKLALARFYSVINSTLKLPNGDLDRYQALARTAQFEIAETHFQAGEYVEASKFYVRLGLLELAAADRAEIQFKAAHAQRLQGDRERCVATLRSFLEQWPNDENVPEARYLLAVTYRELNRPHDAFAATLDLLKTAQAAAGGNPKRWAYWQRRTGNQLANDFFEAGDTLNARAIYARLLELSAEPAWRLPTTYQLALCYERLGQADQAREAYQTIVDGTKGTASAEWAELARMAGWRLEHLGWREKAGAQVSALLETTTGKQAAAPKPAVPSSNREPGPITPGT